MFRRLVVHCLVAVLLACPLWCATAGAAAHSDQPASGDCGCCHHRHAPAHQHEAPGVPSPEQTNDGCEQCLCGGALASSETLFEVAVAPSASMLEAPPLSVAAPDSFWLPDNAAPAWQLAGRPLRLFERSLQI